MKKMFFTSMTKRQSMRSVMLATLLSIIVIAGLYVLACHSEVPAESSLAGDFQLRQLDDVNGHPEILNSLNGGESYWGNVGMIALGVLFYGTACMMVVIGEDRSVALGLALYAGGAAMLLKLAGRGLGTIVFKLDCIRSGAQVLLEQHYGLRVIVARIEVWCQQSGCHDVSTIICRKAIWIFVLSSVVAFVFESMVRKKQEEMLSQPSE